MLAEQLHGAELMGHEIRLGKQDVARRLAAHHELDLVVAVVVGPRRVDEERLVREAARLRDHDVDDAHVARLRHLPRHPRAERGLELDGIELSGDGHQRPS